MRTTCWLLVLLVPAALAIAEEPPRLDSWGDSLPEGAIDRLVARRHRVADEPQSIAISADGHTLAASTWGWPVQVLDVETGRLKADAGVVVDKQYVLQVALSPDGGRLAVAYSTDGVRIFEIEDGKAAPEGRLIPRPGVRGLAFTPDGKVLIGLSERTLFRADPADGRISLEKRSGEGTPYGMVLAPDGLQIAAGYREGRLRVWDSATLELRTSLTAGEGEVWGVAVSPDGARVATCCGDEVCAWDSDKGTRLWKSKPGRAGGITWTDGGRQLAAAIPDAGITILNASDGAVVKSLGVWNRTLSNPPVAATPDGKRFAVGWCSLVPVFDLPAGKVLFEADPASMGITDVALSSRGDVALSVVDFERLSTIDVVGKQRRQVETGLEDSNLRASRGTGDITLLGYGEKRAVVLQAPWKERMKFENLSMDAKAATILADGRTLAVVDHTGFLHLLTSDGTRHDSIPLVQGEPAEVDFSPDGALVNILTRTDVSVFSLPDGKLIESFKLERFYGRVHFLGARHPVLLIHDDKHTSVRGLGESGDEALDVILPSYPDPAPSWDGRFVASARGGVLFIYETASWKLVRRLTAPEGRMDHSAFSRDGTRLLVATSAGTLLLFDARPPVPAATMPVESAWEALAGDDAGAAWKAQGSLVGAGDTSVEWITAQLDKPPPSPFPATLVLPAGPHLQRLRAIVVLEWIGSETARAALERACKSAWKREATVAGDSLPRIEEMRNLK